jgi:hypothetical protein
MAEFSVRITGDGSDLAQSLGQAQGQVRQTQRAINAEARRAEAERTRNERRSAAEAAKIERQRRQVAARELAQHQRTMEQFARRRDQMEKERTRTFEAEARRRERSEEQHARRMDSLNRRFTAARVARERQAAEITRRAQQRAARDAVQQRAGRLQTQREVIGALGGIVGGAAMMAGGVAMAAFSGRMDQVREANQTRDRVELGSAQVASAIGDPRAARQIFTAVSQTARETGLDSGDIVAGLEQAQNQFSALGNAESRASYLATVLPQLAQVAVATNTPLADVVSTAGELQRQLGIGNSELPDTLARVIVAGREGSVSFTDMARSMGVLGGSIRGIMGGGQQTLDTLNTLFQFGGRAGGTGGEAATRTEAFIGNLNSERGQEALRGLVGHDILDQRGQLITRDGEGQRDAFVRLMEEAYARARGNATTFSVGVAGGRKESQALARQLFMDMSAHGGRLQDFRGMIERSQGHTADAVQGAGFRDISQTTAMRHARDTNATIFANAEADGTGAARRTDEALREMQRAGGVQAAIAGMGVTKSALDVAHALAPQASVEAQGDPAEARTQRELLMTRFRRLAAADVNQENERSFLPAFMQGDVQTRTEERAQQMMQDYVRAHPALSNQQLDRPLTMTPQSADAVGAAVARHLAGTPLQVQQTAFGAMHGGLAARHGEQAAVAPARR